MKEKINIAKILKDKPRGTKLYSSACGKCELKEADDKIFKVSFYSSKSGFMIGGEGTFDKNGNIFIIERLKEAISLGKNEIKVCFLIRKIKKNGEPYQYANEAWGIDYFSLEKVVE